MNAPDEEISDGSTLDSGFNSIRIRPELRAAQVKRAVRMMPALTLYFDEKYDLGETELPTTFRKVNLLQCLRLLAFSNAHILEVPEPLWVRFAPKNLLLLATWKVAGIFKSGKRMAVTYAIENNDIENLLSPGSTVHPLIGRIFRVVAGAAIRLSIDRIAFGSSAAMNVYHSLPGVKNVEHRLIDELPARSVGKGDAIPDAAPGAKALFVGELDDRKGILVLMEVWPSVEDALPEAVLTVVGGGHHAELVKRWCDERPSTRVFCGFLPHEETAKQFVDSAVLIAPSRRSGRWREQIGLPIVEAVSVGLTVVTTDETGLAGWLSKEGHIVLPETEVDRLLAAAITRALARPIPREKVLQSLPTVPGRITSDSWLHTTLVPDVPRTTK